MAKKKTKRSSKKAGTGKKGTSKKVGKKTAKKRAVKKGRPKQQKASKKKAGKKTAGKKTAGKKKAGKKTPQRAAAKKKTAKTKTAPRAAAKRGVEGARIGVGDPAPAFELPDQDGNRVSSADLSGRPYVLYFYPKDDTPGCTREACGFRDDLAAFDDLGVRVIGVSPDSVASHKRFEDKYGLTFTLLSDTERELASAYGAYVLKKNYGREYMGIERSTFVVDDRGQVAFVWRNVKVDGHVAKVREAVNLLS